MKTIYSKKQYDLMRAKMNIAMTSKMYDDDENRRQTVIKYYRQCMSNIMHRRPLPAYPA